MSLILYTPNTPLPSPPRTAANPAPSTPTNLEESLIDKTNLNWTTVHHNAATGGEISLESLNTAINDGIGDEADKKDLTAIRDKMNELGKTTANSGDIINWEQNNGLQLYTMG